jgi:hypothetical protein
METFRSAGDGKLYYVNIGIIDTFVGHDMVSVYTYSENKLSAGIAMTKQEARRMAEYILQITGEAKEPAPQFDGVQVGDVIEITGYDMQSDKGRVTIGKCYKVLDHDNFRVVSRKSEAEPVEEKHDWVVVDNDDDAVLFINNQTEGDAIKEMIDWSNGDQTPHNLYKKVAKTTMTATVKKV